ncbi:Helicase conserved C-terminal domain containing protein [Klebsormidium nitens]|uniref:DNA 3'-5' helicase n=1 Tax=Klebsormidium nitens TaxID=105231 RepID=A0A1Y1HUQ4_KLENI|nr:Helicase conserved C-terminal domain containing protein [Klebsormidium nitens]|eukprot:GAQ80266.1 Helicase conserved C-terminal domain containing protein [Klebsormidium nitens]
MQGNLQRTKLPKPKQKGGLLGDVLGNGNNLASARGGHSFSRWLPSDGERGEERSNVSTVIPVEADNAFAEEGLSANPRNPSHNQDRLSRDPNSPQRSQKGASSMIADSKVKLPFQPAAQGQGRSSGSYAGAGSFSKKHGSFTGFAKLQQVNGLLAEQAPELTGSGPEQEARAPSSMDTVPPSERLRTDNSCPRSNAVAQTHLVGIAACESEIDNDQGVQRTEECFAESIGQERQAGEGAGQANQGQTAGGHAELPQFSKLDGRRQEPGSAEPVPSGQQEAAEGGTGAAVSRPIEADLGASLGSSLQAGGAIEARLLRLTVVQLKQQLEGRGLVCRGKKQELVARLVGAILEEGDLSNWEESLGVLDAGGWGNPSLVLKRGAKSATARGESGRGEKHGAGAVAEGSQEQCVQDGKSAASKASTKRKAGAKQKRAKGALAEGATSESSDEDVQIFDGASKRSLRSKSEKGEKETAGQDEDAPETASEKSFDSNDLSDSDDDYKPPKEGEAVAAEAEAAQVASEGEADSGDPERQPRGKRKRAAGEESSQKRSKAKKVAAAGEPVSRSKGTKRSRTVSGPGEEMERGGTKRAAAAKRRAELQAVGWGGPVRTSRATGKASGNFSSAGLPVRDNFVRQTINGRGGGRKRFTNGGRSSFRSKSGTRPFKRNWGKSRRGGKTGSRPTGRGAAPGSEEPGEGGTGEGWGAEEQPGLFKNEGWLPASAGSAVQTPETESLGEPSIPCQLVDQAEPPPASVSNCPNDAETEAAMQAARGDPSESNLLIVLQRLFSFDDFREGQLAAIQRVLAQRSTMLVLPTGAGKSLCYQLPALLLPSLTLVISPLVALMTDQLQHLPPCLPGALISSAQAPWESASVIARLQAGELKVLFISPERLFSETFLAVMASLPPVSLAVVDEAHCVSEWSHNFRPSYHRLGSVLRSRLRVQCVLAMTATATPKTEAAVAAALALPDDAIIRSARVRENLRLSVSKEANKMYALAAMLKTGPCAKVKSVIVYCIFQAQTDQVAAYLEANGISAKSYHSGKHGDERARIQQRFCANKLRVVVATVAFGMGLDKSDVGAVIHYNMPRSLEHYVQEIGRAGRDGSLAHCHLFLDDADYIKLRSLAHSDGCDANSVLRFLSKVFVSDGSEVRADPAGMECRAVEIEATATELDLKEEVMATILSALEVGDAQYVRVLSQLSATCTVTFHGRSPAALAEAHPLAAAILRLCPQPKQGRFTFDVPSLASALREPLATVQRELQRLQSAREIQYEVKDPAFCFSVLRQPEDLAALSRDIAQRLDEVEQCKVAKLDAMYSAAAAAAAANLQTSPSSSAEDANALLHRRIAENFSTGEDADAPLPGVFLNGNKHAPLTGRAVARIFHGLWSPAFPYQDWCKNHFWGRYADVNFHDIRRIATAALVEAKCNR